MQEDAVNVHARASQRSFTCLRYEPTDVFEQGLLGRWCEGDARRIARIVVDNPSKLYDFVPMPERKALKWPNGKRLAVMLTNNLEHWDKVKDSTKPYYPGGPGIGHDAWFAEQAAKEQA